MEKEVSKAEFKKAYMQYRGDNDGWSDDYWQHFFEDEEGKRYFLSPPESPRHNRLFINTSSDRRHMYFLTLQSEEGFFDNPGKSWKRTCDCSIKPLASLRWRPPP